MSVISVNVSPRTAQDSCSKNGSMLLPNPAVAVDTTPSSHGNQTKPADAAGKYLLTAGIISAFLIEAMCMSVAGPSVVSLEIILGVTTKKLSSGFVGRGFGFLVGCVINGFLYSRVRRELLLVAMVTVLGVATLATPLVENLAFFIAVMVIQGVSLGIADTCCQGLMLSIWQNHKLQPVVFQSMYASYGVGSIIGPFITTPFLADITNRTAAVANTSWTTASPDTSDDFSSEIRQVRYAFIICGSLTVFPAVLLLSSALFNRKRDKQELENPAPKCDIESPGTSSGRRTRKYRVLLLAATVTGIYCFSFIQNTVGTYVANYAVKYLGWPNNHGGLVTSAYFVGDTLSKVLCIYGFVLLTSRQILWVGSVGCCVSFIVMNFSAYHVSVLWVAACLSGFTLAPTQASFFMWANRYIRVTGKLSSLFMCFYSVGAMVGLLLAPILFEELGISTFPYIGICVSAVMVLAVGTFDFASRRLPRIQQQHTVEMKRDELKELAAEEKHAEDT